VKRIFVVFMLCLFTVMPLFAQEKSIHPLEIDIYRSYAVDVTVGQRYEWSQLEEGNIKLETGHQIEFFFTINRRPVLIPEEYVLELSTDMDNAKWQYEMREPVKASKTYVWETPYEHEKAYFEVQLTAFVPKTIDKVKEPGFQRPEVEEDYVLDGIKVKTCSVKLAVYKSYGPDGPGDFDSTVAEITYQATNQRINQFVTEINQNLATDDLEDWDEKSERNKFKEYKKEADKALSSIEDMANEIRNLSEEGHPGWALNLSRKFKDVVRNLQKLPGEKGGTPFYIFLLLAIFCCGGGLLAGTFLYRLKGSRKPSVEYLDITLKGLEKTARNIEDYRSSIAGIDESVVRETRLKLSQFRKQIETEISNLKYFKSDTYE